MIFIAVFVVPPRISKSMVVSFETQSVHYFICFLYLCIAPLWNDRESMTGAKHLNGRLINFSTNVGGRQYSLHISRYNASARLSGQRCAAYGTRHCQVVDGPNTNRVWHCFTLLITRNGVLNEGMNHTMPAFPCTKLHMFWDSWICEL